MPSSTPYTIDDTSWKPVKTPGLTSPRFQASYHDPQVQSILKETFGNIFPEIVVSKKTKYYQQLTPTGKDLVATAQPAKNIADIPKGELLRLMEGWIRLRRRLQDASLPKPIRGILLNLKIPDPRRSLERYLLYKVGDESRLLILWGYEQSSAPAISVERALSVFLDVPTGHLQSILSTSLPTTTSTVPISLDTTTIANLRNQPASSHKHGQGFTNKTFVLIAGAAASPTLCGYLLATLLQEKVPNTTHISSPSPELTTTPSPEDYPTEVIAVSSITPSDNPAATAETHTTTEYNTHQPTEPALPTPATVVSTETQASLMDSLVGKTTPDAPPSIDINSMLPQQQTKQEAGLLDSMSR